MEAIELKGMLLEEDRNKLDVIAIGNGFWWHIHDDEELPGDKKIGFCIRETGVIFSLEEAK